MPGDLLEKKKMIIVTILIYTYRLRILKFNKLNIIHIKMIHKY